MKIPYRRWLMPLLIAGLLGGSLATPPLLAAEAQEQLSVAPGRTLSPRQAQTLSRSAAQVLRQIAQARGAIHDNKLDVAKADLDQARALLDRIKSERPTAQVRDHLWVARKHLDYEDTEEVAQDLVPIYADLTAIEDIVPVAQARTHLDNAKAQLAKGDKQAARKELAAVADALVYTEVDLPLASTERRVMAAQDLLAQGQPQAANEALKAAEGGVQVLSVAATRPVAQARRSLWRASRDYSARKYADARKDLAAAETWLERARDSTDQTTRDESAKLKRSVQALNAEIAKGGEHSEAALTGLWHRSVALSERETERASAGWHRLRAGSAAKADLIDAKLHLAYARTAQFVSGTTAEVKSELGQAQADLDSAAKGSDQSLKTRISALDKEIDQMRAHADDKGAQARARYEKVKTELRQEIENL